MKQVAVESAAHWELQVGRVVGDRGLALVKDMPNGSLFPAHKMEAPTIKRATYNALLKVVGFDPLPAEKSESDAAKPDKYINPWSAIVVGTKVLHQEDGDEGYYFCTVTGVSADLKILTLKWRDCPKLPTFKVKRIEVGLIQVEK